MCSNRCPHANAFLAAALALTGLAGLANAAPPGYTAQVFQFDPFPGDPDTPRYTSAHSLNNQGHFLGVHGLSNTAPFVYSAADGMRTLASIYGQSDLYGAQILDSGVIVGAIFGSFGASTAFVAQPDGTLNTLPSLGGDPALSTFAAAANASGMIVGSASTQPQGMFGAPSVAAAWIDGQVHSLGTLGGEYASATAVNSHGVVVGGSESVAFGPARAFRWTANDGMVELATPGYDFASARAITDDGYIIGEVATGALRSAAVWSPDGELTVVPWVYEGGFFRVAEVFGANSLGDFVGQETNDTDGISAIVWLGGVGYDLADFAFDLPDHIRLDRAVGINDHGQILVNAFDTLNTEFVTVLLTPIPAPSAGVLLASGALVFARRRR